MPNPKPGEEREDFLDRCIPEVVGEGYEPDQAVAICIAYFEGEKDKAFDIAQDNRIEYWKAFDRRRQSFETKFTRVIYRAIKEMLSGLEDATNANELQKPLKIKPLEDAYVDLYTEVGDRFARNTYAGLKRMEYEETKRQPAWIERMRKYAIIDASQRIKGIEDITRRQINRIIVAGLEEGSSIDQIRDRIMGVPGLPPLNGNLPVRARRIARTEIISASNLGSLEGALSTGLNFRKQWLSTPDSRTRPDHVDANGQQVDRDSPFRVGGEDLIVPGDPKGSGSNVINCRCTQIYITEDVQTSVPQPQPPQGMTADDVIDRASFNRYFQERGIDAYSAPENLPNDALKSIAKQHDELVSRFGEAPPTLKRIDGTLTGVSAVGNSSIGVAGATGDRIIIEGTIKLNSSKEKDYWKKFTQETTWNKGWHYMSTYTHEMIHQYDNAYTAMLITRSRTMNLTVEELDVFIRQYQGSALSRSLYEALVDKYGEAEVKRRTLDTLGQYAYHTLVAKSKSVEIPTLAFERHYAGRGDDFTQFIVDFFTKKYREVL